MMDEQKNEAVAAQSIGAVVGENLRTLRLASGQTQQVAATLLVRWGLRWTRAQVASFELGRRESVNVEELLKLCFAYDNTLPEWFAGEGSVAIDASGQIVVTREDLREALSGRTFRYPVIVGEPSTISDEAEMKAARSLGVDVGTIQEAARHLWRQPLTYQRDGLLEAETPPGGYNRSSVPGVRAAITRRLLKEVRAHIEGMPGGDSET